MLRLHHQWNNIDLNKESFVIIRFGAGFTDNSSVSVVPNGDGSGVLSLTESVAGTYRASTADLSTLGRVDFKDGVEGLLTTAHPTVMKDGTMINLTSGVGGLNFLQLTPRTLLP